MYGLASPKATTWPINADEAWIAISMLAGERFFPASLTSNSFLRSTIVTKPCESMVPMSPVCNQPSASIASVVFSG